MLPTSPYDAGKVDYITETVVNQYAGDDAVCRQATAGEVRHPRERGDGGMTTGGTDTISAHESHNPPRYYLLAFMRVTQ